MNLDNREKIEEVFKKIDAINADLHGLHCLKNELTSKYPRVMISYAGLSYSEKIDISEHKHAIETLIKAINETLHHRLDHLEESLINL